MATRELDLVVPFTGWAYTDAVACMNCPTCGQLAGHACRTKKGYKRNGGQPHPSRVMALADTGYTANRKKARWG